MFDSMEEWIDEYSYWWMDEWMGKDMNEWLNRIGRLVDEWMNG